MPPVVIDLTGLSPSDGFVIQGDAAGDSAGRSVSIAGDINGDGVDDLIVGAYGSDDGGDNAGEAYVIYGTTGTRGLLDLTNLTASDGFIIRGDAAGDKLGVNVSGVGDVNGDGIDDLIVRALRSEQGCYVVYGKSGASRGTVDITGLVAADGFNIRDGAFPYSGRSISGAGDVNGDGIDDIIVGNIIGDDGGSLAGEAYVIYGRLGTRGAVDVSSLSATDGFVIQGDAAFDTAGRSVSGAGDVNGDGIDDVIVGASRGDDGGEDAGEAYVIYGRTGTRGRVDLTGLAASDGFIVQGDAFGDRAGFSVSNAGDINGDGIDDFIVGAYFGDDGGSQAGEAYVIYGRIGSRGLLDLTGLAASDGFIIQGDSGSDQAGWSVSNAGDVNGDGIDDLIVGAWGGDDGGDRAGEAYVIFGRSGTTRATVDLTGLLPTDGFIIQGDAERDLAGWSVSGGGDVNGDGLADLIVGAPYGDDGGYSAGEAYVVYGRLEAGAIGGTSAADFLTGTTAADAIYGLAGNDLLYGDLGNDRLFGADGSDALFGQEGDDVLSGGADQDKLDGGADNDIVRGGADGDSMRGGDGDDILDGGSGNDAMNGGTGIDIFTGGEGRDKFRFRDGDTGNSVATADRITDLDQAQGERVSLTLMDAIVGGADDAFTFIGTSAFGNVAGQLRYELIGGNTYVMGDTDGDGTSDFMIRLDGALVLTGADFSL